MARARSLMLSAAAFGVVGLLAWSITQELMRDPVIIEPLTVPESLAKDGWTGEVLARQIRDGVREINEGAKTQRPRANYLFDREQVDIVVPGASISIRTLVTVFRGVLGQPARRIAGEVIVLNSDEHPAACKKASAAGSRYFLVGRLNSDSHPWAACAGTIEELPNIAARELVLATTPYIYAAYQYERDPDQAKTIAKSILANKKMQGDHPAALTLLGIMLYNKKQYADAIEKYEESLLCNPSNAVVYNNLGNVLLEMKRPEDAIDKYREAVIHNKSYANAYYNWGTSLLVLKKPEEAIEKFKEAQRHNPDDADIYYNWGSSLLELGRPKEAINKYQEAWCRDPNNPATYGNWGNSLLALKRPEDAIRKYQEVVRLDPGYADTYYNWALALHALGRNDEAALKEATYECLSQGKKLGECQASVADTGAASTALSNK